MDKNQIIEKILAEVALKSGDGFLDGFRNPQNVYLLQETLINYGLSEAEAADVADDVQSKELEKKPRKGRTPKPKPYDLSDEDKNWKYGEISAQSLKAKKFPDHLIPSIIKKLKEKTSEGANVDESEKLFINMFDGLGLEEVQKKIEPYYKAGASYDENHIIGYLDALAAKSKIVGRGEYPLLFVLKGASSGGGKTGDLKVGNAIIDVKEAVNYVVRVEDNSFSEKPKFFTAIDELTSFCSVEENKNAILNLLTTLNTNPPNSNVQLSPEEYKLATKFMKNPGREGFGKNVYAAIAKCRQYFSSIKPEDKLEAISSTADFKIQDKEVEVAVDIPDSKSKQTIENPPQQSTPIQLNVSAIVNKEKALILPKISKLMLFSDPSINPEQLGKEMMALLHYDGMIILYKSAGQRGLNAPITGIQYVSDLKSASGWDFARYSKGVNFVHTSYKALAKDAVEKQSGE
jgi:hypothetical protein